MLNMTSPPSPLPGRMGLVTDVYIPDTRAYNCRLCVEYDLSWKNGSSGHKAPARRPKVDHPNRAAPPTWAYLHTEDSVLCTV
jgi:hypothetical protein